MVYKFWSGIIHRIKTFEIHIWNIEIVIMENLLKRNISAGASTSNYYKGQEDLSII